MWGLFSMCVAHSLSLCYSLFDLSPSRPFSIPPSLSLSLSLLLSRVCVHARKRESEGGRTWFVGRESMVCR